MYIILDDNFKFIGFSLKKEENYQSIEISEQEHWIGYTKLDKKEVV